MPYSKEERMNLFQLEQDILVLKQKMKLLLPAFQGKCGHEIVVQGERMLIINTAIRVCTICKLEEHGFFEETGAVRGFKLLGNDVSREVCVVSRDTLEIYRTLQLSPVVPEALQDRTAVVMAKALKHAQHELQNYRHP